MPRIDDYKQAFALAKEELSKKNPKRLADQAKGEFALEDGNPLVTIKFLGRNLAIYWPEIEMYFLPGKEEVQLQQRVLVAHYLNGLKQIRPEGEWISFQEVPDGRFYMDAFQRRAKVPLVKAFGDRPELLLELAKNLFGAVQGDQGDVSVIVEPLPHVPVMLIIWKGDEEFPPEGSILFDRTIIDLLSAEDIAWLSGMVVYPLVGERYKRG